MATVYEAANKTFLTPAVDENSSVIWSVEVNHYPSSKNCSILSGVILDDEVEDKASTNVNSGLTIFDCSRRVCLDFGVYGDKDADAQVAQKLSKIDLLISQLEEYRQNLATSYAMKLSMDEESK